MIKDFVHTLTDWEKETTDKYSYAELYAKTWAECRNFVLPMNPVRKELEYAVKAALSECGVKAHQAKQQTKQQAKQQAKSQPKSQPKKAQENKPKAKKNQQA